MIRPNGSELIVPRKKITLTSDAFPTIFNNIPGYLTEHLPPQRKDPNERRKAIIKRDETEFAEW